MTIHSIEHISIPKIISSFAGSYLETRKKRLEQYLEEYKSMQRESYFIFDQNQKCNGYITLFFNPDHLYFKKNKIPEIKDLNVLPNARHQGYGTQLIQYVENQATALGYHKIGLGVGMHRDYGSAQRLYIKQNYIPTGEGLYANGRPIDYNENVNMNHDLLMYLSKTLNHNQNE